jgi:hypothetical protein
VATYPQKVDGTPQTWASSGGSQVITCTSLAAAAARQGAKSSTFNDGTLGNPIEYRIKLIMQFTSAPTASGTVDVYFGQSSSATAGTDNPGGLSGSDAAVTGAVATDTSPQMDPAGSLVASNGIGTGVQQQSEFVIPRKGLYLCPLIVNNASQAFDSTALHTVLTVTPVFWKIP